MNPQIKLLFLSLPFIHSARASIWRVTAGDVDDLKLKISGANSGDTILIPPGLYTIDDAFEGGDLCSPLPFLEGNDPFGIILRGTGSDATKTKLVGVSIEYCESYMVIDNLSLYSGTCKDGAIIEEDGGGTILRNSIVYPSYKSAGSVSFDIMSHRIGFINTVIENQFPYPDTQKIGISDEGNGLVMINSKMTGFSTALDLNRFYWSDYPSVDYKVHNTVLAANGINCRICTASEVCTNSCTALTSLPRNTPANQKFTVGNFIDILRFDSYDNIPYVPVEIYFLKVKTGGETTVYRLPSAYPEPPNGLKSGQGNVQYYQFDSTAVMSAVATMYFDKSAIAAEFPAGSAIKVYWHTGVLWSLLSTTVVNRNGKDYYSFSFPNKVTLSGLIGFFS